MEDGIFRTYYQSPIGKICITGSENTIKSVLFTDADSVIKPVLNGNIVNECEQQLKAYFSGSLNRFSLQLEANGTVFQENVWQSLLRIPFGETRTYAQIATDLGNPKVIRAAASANGANPIAIIIPCHRVLGSDGKLVGYSGGLWRKEWLLRHESIIAGTKKQLEIF
jgi:methylated-DNA-[protein]-cysteine S-methyltransferase